MYDDVEMQDASTTKPHSTSRRSPIVPPSTTTSRSSSASPHNDAEVISITSREPSIDHQPIPIIVETVDDDTDIHTKPKLSTTKNKPSSSVSKPASTATAKPKSAKPVRARSRSPTPPAPPPPLQTIRLDIKLGGPDNYEVDISSFAKATGQRQPTPPPPPKRDTSDSEDDEDSKERPKKKKKKNLGTEYYDISDPFIDDSELAIDERTYFAQTKQQGFYVSSGEVALLKDKTPKKTKPRKSKADESASAAGPSNPASTKEETKDAPVSETRAPTKRRKNYTIVEENGKKRKVVDIREFHPELQKAFEDLKVIIAKESWETKGKFPPSLKPVLAEVALKAIHLNEYDDDFFNLMPALFPYNRYTMTKLIKRTIFQDHVKLIVSRQDTLLEDLNVITKEGFVKAQDEYEKSVTSWEKRQEKIKAGAETGVAPGEAPPTSVISVSHRQSTEDAASGMECDNPPATNEKDGTGKDGNKESHPPTQRYRMTDAMKAVIWQLVMLSNERCRLENEKNELDGNNAQISEQGLRKVLYQKIVAAFPPNWMNSSQISREVSIMKKRLEKEAMENEN